jgi:hypothetical protein
MLHVRDVPGAIQTFSGPASIDTTNEAITFGFPGVLGCMLISDFGQRHVRWVVACSSAVQLYADHLRQDPQGA